MELHFQVPIHQALPRHQAPTKIWLTCKIPCDHRIRTIRVIRQGGLALTGMKFDLQPNIYHFMGGIAIVKSTVNQ